MLCEDTGGLRGAFEMLDVQGASVNESLLPQLAEKFGEILRLRARSSTGNRSTGRSLPSRTLSTSGACPRLPAAVTNVWSLGVGIWMLSAWASRIGTRRADL
jgi:hypothetical protein